MIFTLLDLCVLGTMGRQTESDLLSILESLFSMYACMDCDRNSLILCQRFIRLARLMEF